jgi:hypothetical protein
MTSALVAEDKLGFDDRIEIVRGLTAEYATLKAYLPKSKKPLVFDSNGTYDAKQWEQIGKESGPAARTGDQIQITKVTLAGSRAAASGTTASKSGWAIRPARSARAAHPRQAPTSKSSSISR